MATRLEQLPTERQQENESVAYKRGFVETPRLTSLIPPSYIALPFLPAPPAELLLGSLRDGRLRVQLPIKVKVTTEGKHIIAEAVEFDEYGFGTNFSEALIDLQHAITELYFTLDEEQDRLGSDIQSIWGKLSERIHRVQK